MGVLQTTVGELVTLEEHQRMSSCGVYCQMSGSITKVLYSSCIFHNAICLVPRVRKLCAGVSRIFPFDTHRSILGPSLGGALAQPCISYPGIFPPGSIFERFPYLLPNLVCTVIVSCGVVIGVLFLEETHSEKKYRRDVGIEAG